MNRIKKWSIKKTFERYYKFFNYPFETANSYISKLNPVKKEKYYREIYEYRKSEAFDVEWKSLIKACYKELAEGNNDKISRDSYRLVLIFLKKYEQRLNHLCEIYQGDKLFKETQDKLNK